MAVESETARAMESETARAMESVMESVTESVMELALGMETVFIHRLSSLLSAYGMKLAALRATRQRAIGKTLLGCEAATFVSRQAGLTFTAEAAGVCFAGALGALAAGLAFKTSRAALLSASEILRPGRA